MPSSYQMDGDDVTAAQQLLSYLEGDALNVALLVPEMRRAMGRPGRTLPFLQ